MFSKYQIIANINELRLFKAVILKVWYEYTSATQAPSSGTQRNHEIKYKIMLIHFNLIFI